MRRQLPYILGGVVAGSMAARYTAVAPEPLAVFAGLCLCSILFTRRPLLHHLHLFLVFTALSAMGYCLHTERISSEHILRYIDPERLQSARGRIVSPLEMSEEKMTFRLSAEECEGESVSGIVRVTVYAGHVPYQNPYCGTRLAYGDYIEINGRFRQPENYGNPGAFDYKAFLARKGVHVIAAVAANKIKVLQKEGGNRVMRHVYKKRREFQCFINSVLPRDERRILTALITGDRSGIEPEMRRRFSRAGAAHLIAISGLHIGFIAVFSYLILTAALRYLLTPGLLTQSFFWITPTRPAAAITLVFLLYYTLFVGAPTSSVRAFFMIALYLVSKIAERSRGLMHALMTAALLILLWQPASLLETDFQLSFAAVAAMVLYNNRTGQEKNSLGPASSNQSLLKRAAAKMMSNLAQLLVISLLALSATAALSASVFHSVSLSGLLLNIFLVPLTGFWIIPWGILSLVLFPVCPVLAHGSVKMAGTGTRLLIETTRLAEEMTWSSFWVFTPPPWLLAGYYLALAVTLLLPRIRGFQRTGIVLALLAAFLAANEHIGRFRPDGRLHMRFLDVGNGSSTLLVLPRGTTVLVDGGGHGRSSMDVGRQIVLPALLSLGIKEIDCVVLSHPHPDHLNGLIGILEEIPVGEVWDGWEGTQLDQYKDFRRIIEDRGIPRRSINEAGEKIRLDGVLFEVMQSGGAGDAVSNAEINDHSVVLRISLGGVSLLLPGDLEKEGEKRLVEQWGDALSSTILLVPHHGSLTSSRPMFLDAVRPEIAVISVGRSNRFHHPSTTVLGRLAYIVPEKVLYRTDEDGSIWIYTDGKSVTSRCFNRGHSP
jgi:competence protein ComEC